VKISFDLALLLKNNAKEIIQNCFWTLFGIQFKEQSLGSKILDDGHGVGFKSASTVQDNLF
jgi:hypothetical protein